MKKDPVEIVIEQIRNDNQLRGMLQSELRNESKLSTFLNRMGALLERYGFGALDARLLELQQRASEQGKAKVMIQVVKHLKTCEPIRERRGIGRAIIKALPAIFKRSD